MPKLSTRELLAATYDCDDCEDTGVIGWDGGIPCPCKAEREAQRMADLADDARDEDQ